MRRAGRRRTAAAAALVGALVVAAAALAGGVHRASPTKLTIWVGWSAGHELTTFKQVAAEYDRNHCRKLVMPHSGSWMLSTHGQSWLDLLAY